MNNFNKIEQQNSTEFTDFTVDSDVSRLSIKQHCLFTIIQG